MKRNANGITPDLFLDRHGRRVLTDDGIPGINGLEGSGSTTEVIQSKFAGMLFNEGERLDKKQLTDIKR